MPNVGKFRDYLGKIQANSGKILERFPCRKCLSGVPCRINWLILNNCL